MQAVVNPEPKSAAAANADDENVNCDANNNAFPTASAGTGRRRSKSVSSIDSDDYCDLTRESELVDEAEVLSTRHWLQLILFVWCVCFVVVIIAVRP